MLFLTANDDESKIQYRINLLLLHINALDRYLM